MFTVCKLCVYNVLLSYICLTENHQRDILIYYEGLRCNERSLNLGIIDVTTQIMLETSNKLQLQTTKEGQFSDLCRSADNTVRRIYQLQ